MLLKVQLSVRAEDAFPDAQQRAAAWKSSRKLGKNRRSLIHLGYGVCQCNMGCLGALQLGGKEDVAQGCMRRSIIRKASEVLAGGEASERALCLVRDQMSRKIQTNWKEQRGWQ